MLGRFTLAIMELDCELGRQMILVEFGFALNRITLSFIIDTTKPIIAKRTMDT